MTLISHEKLEDIFGEGDGGIAKYKLDLEIPGSYSRDLRKKSVASLKKNSEFKGFRKGTIPPFIRKDIDGFVLQDSISDMISKACAEARSETSGRGRIRTRNGYQRDEVAIPSRHGLSVYLLSSAAEGVTVRGWRIHGSRGQGCRRN